MPLHDCRRNRPRGGFGHALLIEAVEILLDLPVLTLKDRTVWWRLTLGGVPPQAFKNPVFRDPGVAPMGTPLVTLNVTQIVTRRR